MAEAKDKAGRFGIGGRNNEWGNPDPDPERNGVQDVDMADSPATMTPAHTTGPTSSTRPFARPTTRSMTKPGDVMVAMPYGQSSFRERLQRSSKKTLPTPSLSGLEEAKSIVYGDEDHGNEPQAGEDNVDSEMQDQDKPLVSPTLKKHSGKHPKTKQPRMPTRQSARLGGHKSEEAGPLDLAPTVKKRARKSVAKAKPSLGLRYLRRSRRLSKPLTEFHLFGKLPNELKIMVWEFAITPRLLYIRNRAALLQVMWFGLHIPSPGWFMTSTLSLWVSRLHYQQRFSMDLTNHAFNVPTAQDFTHSDIVIYEPCHGACRGCHCARHQYSQADRSAVRFLAVQTESQNLPADVEPCWQSITRSWPNVETLYLMRIAVRGTSRFDKAMIRVHPNDFELQLLTKFEEWKKGDGKDVTISKLEFVVVVPKEGPNTDYRQRYRSVDDRVTGRPEDIILE
ncbi:hypothetical protein F5Y13DRAFT_196740 [Hypoxylon sp. FL1857]|nr:hypothetical protein F5Y13DRAFT_196740 [Hypoxylon sp. FL1857]